MKFLPSGQGFLGDGGRPVSAQNAFGKYFDLTGRVPSYIFLGDSLDSQLPKSPTITLVPGGTALVNQAFPVDAEGEPNDSPLITAAYQYTNALGSFHEITDAAILDVDATKSWAMSVCFRTTADAFPVAAGSIFGKREAAGNNLGYELTMGVDGSVTFTHKGADLVQDSMGFSTYNSAAGQHRYADGRLHTFDIEFDIVAGEIRVGNEHEGTMANAWAIPAGSLASTANLRLGAVRAFAAGPFQLAHLIASDTSTAINGDPAIAAYLLAEETSLTTVQRHNNEPIT